MTPKARPRPPRHAHQPQQPRLAYLAAGRTAEAIALQRGDAQAADVEARPRPPRHAHQPQQPRRGLPGRRPDGRGDRAARGDAQAADVEARAPTTPTRSSAATTSPVPTWPPAGRRGDRAARGDAQAEKSKLGPDHPDTLTSRNNLAVGLPGRRPDCRGDRAARGDAEAARRRSWAPTTPTRSSAATTSPRPTGPPVGRPRRSPLHEETLKLRTSKLGPRPPRHARQPQQPRRVLPGRRIRRPRRSRCTRKTLKLMTSQARPQTTPLRRLSTPRINLAAEPTPPPASSPGPSRIYRGHTGEGPEAVRRQRPRTAAAMASVGRGLLMQQKWADAEPVLRECLAVREKIQPDEWSTFNARSMLGGSLLGQKK